MNTQVKKLHASEAEDWHLGISDIKLKPQHLLLLFRPSLLKVKKTLNFMNENKATRENIHKEKLIDCRESSLKEADPKQEFRLWSHLTDKTTDHL